LRSVLRNVAERVATVLAAPLIVAYKSRLVRYDTAGLLLAYVPGAAGIFLRRAWYLRTLTHCGPGLTVQFGSLLCDARATVGDGVYIGYGCRVAYADIGDAVLVADKVSILSGLAHYGMSRRDIPMRDQPGVHIRLRIGEDVWIGDSAVVGADVADHSVVGSGAVVTRTFEPWQIIGGVPARLIGTRPGDDALADRWPSPAAGSQPSSV
jgi:acetyltransferase-like isoleucine patch superfamily enzyme